MRFETPLIAMILIATLAGCDKESAAPVQQTTAAATGETTGAPAAPARAPAAPAAAADFESFDDTQWCSAAHADTVKIVEAMKATMKHAGDKGDSEDEYAPPPQARYVELCGKLPLQMQKCLVVGYAAKNRESCQQALDAMNDEQRAAYGELMGK